MWLFKPLFILYLVSLYSTALSQERNDEEKWVEVREDLYLLEIKAVNDDRTDDIHILRIDKRQWDFDIFTSGDSLFYGSDISEKLGVKASINAGFFNVKEGSAATVLIDEGKSINTDVNTESFTNEGAIVIKKNSGKIDILLQPDYFPKSRRYKDFISSGPMLMWNRRVLVQDTIPFSTKRHPRTAFGMNQQWVYLVVVDGRNEMASGMTLTELANLMESLDCAKAINLDGGGSSYIYLDHGNGQKGIISHPSDNKIFDSNGERAVNSILIVK